MLAHRIIPTLLMRNGSLIKGERFNSWRSVGVAAQAMRVHQMRGVDEVVLFDISASKENREPNYSFISNLAASCFYPLTVGGGIKLEKHARMLLRSGADKVAIGSAAIESPWLIKNLSTRYGPQAVVVVMDIKDGKVWNHVNGEKLSVSPASYARWMVKEGAGEIILQSVDRDGTLEGYDIELIQSVASSVSVPVVASGGCSDYEDMHLALQAGADAVAAGALWSFHDRTPQGAAEYLQSKGWEVRNERRVG